MATKALARHSACRNRSQDPRCGFPLRRAFTSRPRGRRCHSDVASLSVLTGGYPGRHGHDGNTPDNDWAQRCSNRPPPRGLLRSLEAPSSGAKTDCHELYSRTAAPDPAIDRPPACPVGLGELASAHYVDDRAGRRIGSGGERPTVNPDENVISVEPLGFAPTPEAENGPRRAKFVTSGGSMRWRMQVCVAISRAAPQA
jgi:hypothetical protein